MILAARAEHWSEGEEGVEVGLKAVSQTQFNTPSTYWFGSTFSRGRNLYGFSVRQCGVLLTDILEVLEYTNSGLATPYNKEMVVTLENR
jgi:hypothetical protein